MTSIREEIFKVLCDPKINYEWFDKDEVDDLTNRIMKIIGKHCIIKRPKKNDIKH